MKQCKVATCMYLSYEKVFLLLVMAAHVSWWDAWAAKTLGGLYPNEKHLAASYFLIAIRYDLAQGNNKASFVAGWLLSRRWRQIAQTAGGNDVTSRLGRKKSCGETETGQRALCLTMKTGKTTSQIAYPLYDWFYFQFPGSPKGLAHKPGTWSFFWMGQGINHKDNASQAHISLLFPKHLIRQCKCVSSALSALFYTWENQGEAKGRYSRSQDVRGLSRVRILVPRLPVCNQTVHTKVSLTATLKQLPKKSAEHIPEMSHLWTLNSKVEKKEQTGKIGCLKQWGHWHWERPEKIIFTSFSLSPLLCEWSGVNSRPPPGVVARVQWGGAWCACQKWQERGVQNVEVLFLVSFLKSFHLLDGKLVSSSEKWWLYSSASLARTELVVH